MCSDNFASQLTFQQNRCSVEQIHRVPLNHIKDNDNDNADDNDMAIFINQNKPGT